MKITERGWPGHFICADCCIFRRNTLIEHNDTRVIVSTVGNYRKNFELQEIGPNRYYETLVFRAKWEDPYWDTDTDSQISVDGKWSICASYPGNLPLGVDNMANQMHEDTIAEITQRLLKGTL